MNQLNPDDRAAIRFLQITTREPGDGTLERKVALQIWDKRAALEKPARHLGLFATHAEKERNSADPLSELLANFKEP